MTIVVRAMRPGDEPQAEALWKGMSPYRPEDEVEVEAMYEKARRAMDAGDKKWKPLEVSAPGDLLQSYLANWVAAVPSTIGEDRIVGTSQVAGPTSLSQMPTNLALSREWRLRDHIAELSRLRVTDDIRRQGIGTRLVEVVIDWCRLHGFRTLVLNTTTPQKPAIGLYNKLGFREADRTFLDRYELVWFRLDL